MLTGHLTHMIESPLLGRVSILVVIWLLGLLRSRVLYLALVLRLNIEALLMSPLILFGFRLYLLISIFPSLVRLQCGVTILELFISVLILCFILELSMLN